MPIPSVRSHYSFACRRRWRPRRWRPRRWRPIGGVIAQLLFMFIIYVIAQWCWHGSVSHCSVRLLLDTFFFGLLLDTFFWDCCWILYATLGIYQVLALRLVLIVMRRCRLLLERRAAGTCRSM